MNESNETAGLFEGIQGASPGCRWHQFAIDQLNELSILIEWAHERRRQWSAYTAPTGWVITLEVKEGSNEPDTIAAYYLSDIPDSQEDDDSD
jgi:hypothetical protein